VRRLAEEFPRIVGIKDSSGDVSHMSRMIAAVRPIRPDFVFLTGWEPALAAMLAVGCDGGTHATSGVAPELTREVFEAARGGDLPKARAAQARLTDLFDLVMQGGDFPEGFRVAVAARGFRMGPSRQPATESQFADRGRLGERIREKLAALGLTG
jgi:4-hydroxy-tetrahydrodipicolinate synthase